MTIEYWPADSFCDRFAPAAIVIFVLCIIMAVAAVHIIKAALYCAVFSKAGYCWAWGLLALVPPVCIALPFVLALAKWPVQKEIEQLRRQLSRPAPV